MLLDTETPTVRNIPLIVEGHGYCPSDNENTGFPFDSDRDDRFRSRLDDLAQRHPEFAEHLGDFPFRSNSWGRHRRGSDTDPAASASEGFPEYRRFTDRPFGSRFERFGFPFTRHFADRPDFPSEHHQQAEAQPQTPPQQQQQEVPKQQENQAESHKPPQGPDRSRKANPNLLQSNTVDLGQKQEPVNDNRSQRSMSAPPENRSGKRFVSSINIPINRDVGGDEMGSKHSQPEPQKQEQPQQHQKPNERVIPIHVEGRDEPVIPKNVHQTFKQQPPPQQQRVFGQKPSTFTQFVNKPSAPKQQQQQQQQHQQQQQQQQQQPQTEPPQSAQQQQQQKPQKQTPLDQIQSIQKDVLELMDQVEKFAGKPRDKQYLYLDEMLTRNLIKLDNIETEGKDNIRQARKEAIKCIEKCISILESKAAANAEKESLGDNKAVEKTEGEVMDIDKTKQEEEAKLESEIKEEPMETLEVGGISRSGSQAKMEIAPSEKVEEMEIVPETTEEAAVPEQKSLAETNKNEEAKTQSEAAVTTTTQTQPAEITPMEVSNSSEDKVPENNTEMTNTTETTSKNAEDKASQETNNNKEKKKGKKKDKSNK